MEIGNVTQFSNFISSNNLIRLDGIFQEITNCINNYNASCNCYKLSDKQAMYVNCNKLYSNAIKNIIPKFKYDILSKTSDNKIIFKLDNGTIISILSR
jgi:hypothetical protein